MLLNIQYGKTPSLTSKVQEVEARKWFKFHLKDMSANTESTLKQEDSVVGTLPLPICQKAIGNLGIFPTINEVKNMHSVLGEKVVIDNTGTHTGVFCATVSVGINEFLKMIEKLTLAPLDNGAIVSQIVCLRSLQICTMGN